jgi:hypothetical protein
MTLISGKQRLWNLRAKNNIIARRELRQYMAGEIDMLPCSGDRLNDFIAQEFERLSHGEQDRGEN